MLSVNDQPVAQRKQATIVFADLSGFTAMSEDLDPEQIRDIVNRYFEALSAAVFRYQGTIDKYIGDCVMAVFGVPATRENDCERACCAALDMQQAVRDLAETFNAGIARPPELHIGINTGLVVAAGMGSTDFSQYTVMGDAVNLASRLCHEAENGQVAIGHSTWELVRHTFDCSAPEFRSIKGKSGKVPVYFLQSRSAKPSAKRQFQVHMVGRTAEMVVARQRMQETCAGRGSLLYVTGDPGIGKSRLSAEMSIWASQNGMRPLTASSEPLDKIQAYSLWRQLLERLGGETLLAHTGHEPALRASAGLAVPEFELLSETSRFDAIVAAWSNLLHTLQTGQPLLLILDDLQWSDPQSIQLLNSVVDRLPGLALLICVLARPEFRHQWESCAAYYPIALGPLSLEESAMLVRASLGSKDTDASESHLAAVISRADGNPFYLTELAGAADRVADGKLPSTVEGLIVERIDALDKEPRRILELASVIGREFPNRLLSAASDSEQLEAQISHLQELEFVYPKDIAPELLYLFKHYLTQQATYESILIQRRKQLHSKVATAIESEYSEGLEPHYAVLAQHLEKAGEYQRAFEYYRRAGDNVQGSQSEVAAEGLYARGEEVLRLLYSDKPSLKNRWKYIRLLVAAGLVTIFVAGIVTVVASQMGGERLDVIGLAGGIVAASILMSLTIVLGSIFVTRRWAFMVYPDRVRILSKRRTINLPFDQVKKVRVIDLQRKLSLSNWLIALELLCNPRYPRFGRGQTSQVGLAVIRFVRIDCGSGWKRGYTFDMENPVEFVVNLNRALERYRAIRGKPF